MSQLAFAALLIMPLALAPSQARAQMMPVPAADTAQALLSNSPSKLYSTADAIPSESTAPSSSPDRALASHASEPILRPTPPPLSLDTSDTLPLPRPVTPTLASVAPFSAAPVTLPPKPAKVHDLPSPFPEDRSRIRPFQAVAFGLTASTLGTGGELATPATSTLNLRVGAGYLLLRHPFHTDGIDYMPAVKFTSAHATLDWFPRRGAFHLSAGALYFRNNIGGPAVIAEGQAFSLGGTNYINSVDDPVHGTANLTYGKQVAPLALLGFGNILPRSGRHVSVPFEIGGAYMEAPSLSLKLAGTACTSQRCFNAATDPQLRANILKEVSTLQSDLRFLQVFPIMSLGLACRF